MSVHTPDCIVVGAGIAGVCAALHIQRCGAAVTIVDNGKPGFGASFGNAGIVVNTKLTPVFAGLTPKLLFSLLRDKSSPLNVRWSRLVGLAPWFLRMLSHANATEVRRIIRALANLSQSGLAIYEELWRDADMGDLVHHRGSLALNLSVTERDRDWEGILAELRGIGVPMEKAGPAEIRSFAPATSPRYACGVYSPEFHHTGDPQAFVQKLFDLFAARGGRFQQAEIRGIETSDGRAVAVRTMSGRLPAGSVLVAAGTGSARIAKELGEGVPHQSIGGYHVMLDRPGLELETPLLPLDFRFAITPMRAGIRLAGTYEFGGEGLPRRDHIIDDMLGHVAKVLPGIDAHPSSVWRGFRSYLPDGLPVISTSRAVPNLFYLFGLSSAGMINGAAAGRAVARLWANEPSDFDMEPYAIGRFA